MFKHGINVPQKDMERLGGIDYPPYHNGIAKKYRRRIISPWEICRFKDDVPGDR